jgi:hypothetical protein
MSRANLRLSVHPGDKLRGDHFRGITVGPVTVTNEIRRAASLKESFGLCPARPIGSFSKRVIGPWMRNSRLANAITVPQGR